jgi:hypothetical protein
MIRGMPILCCDDGIKMFFQKLMDGRKDLVPFFDSKGASGEKVILQINED